MSIEKELSLLIKKDKIDNVVLVELLKILSDENSFNLFKNFDGNFFEVTYDAAVTTELYAHNLGFIPTDVILTQINPSTETVSWLFENSGTDKKNIVLSTSGACSLRFFLGRYNTNE